MYTTQIGSENNIWITHNDTTISIERRGRTNFYYHTSDASRKKLVELIYSNNFKTAITHYGWIAYSPLKGKPDA